MIIVYNLKLENIKKIINHKLDVYLYYLNNQQYENATILHIEMEKDISAFIKILNEDKDYLNYICDMLKIN